ncbi:nucleotide sugar dehydrogenase [Ophiobolus disseminans]|uniref:Nucleotide sugar dehydrogenase n=1 Tax=Ophiobolus disseminans TaxID=1469910 RepID=A0A6A6ZYJ5_9PLEO|nr:nucleotide sugar dehydrogenase [Ophiobolus disseminans]
MFSISPSAVTQAYQTISTPSELGELAPTEACPIVAVVGVGYVGRHLVETFAHHYDVIAYDVSDKRLDIMAEELKGLGIRFTSSPTELRKASHILISVPTVLNNDKTIDTTYLRSAISAVETHATPGSTVVIESSVAVGMTRALVGPLMASKGLKVGMSPERVDPGRTFPAFEDIPKIVSGLDKASLESISKLYGRVFKKMMTVSSVEVAEMTKLYENCQRMICAAYANEMADACAAIGIDAFEVSQAAASKPFGYLPFQPGPGVGGHCIPVNPYYLLSNCSMPLLEQATTMSWQRPASLARQFIQNLTDDLDFKCAGVRGESVSRVLVVGVGFKRGQSVLSNSPGAAIISTLQSEFDTYVEFADPLVAAEQLPHVTKMNTEANWNREYLSSFDGIIIAVDQVGLDLDVLDGLKTVEIQDYSGRRKSSTRSEQSR